MSSTYFRSSILLTLINIVFNSNCIAQIFTGNDNLQNKRIIVAAPFLLINPDARTSGMGDAGVAMPGDVNSSSINTSKLSFVPDRYGISLSYIPWLTNVVKGMSIGYFSGFYKVDDQYTIGTSLKYFSREHVDLIDNNQQSLGALNPSEFAFDFSLAKKFGPNFSLGTTIRYIYSNLYTVPTAGNIEMQTGKTVGADVSGTLRSEIQFFNSEADLAFGINISNIGPKINYSSSSELKYYLPTNLKIGTAISIIKDKQNCFTFAFDFNKLLVPSPKSRDFDIDSPASDKSVASALFTSFSDAEGGFSEEMKEIGVSTGIEYNYMNQFMIRTGYSYQDASKGDNNYLTFGAGFCVKTFKIDLSYLTGSRNKLVLANTLRFTLGFNFK